MPDRKYGFDTLCLHAGQIPDGATGARALPIYQTTSFVFDSADHAASLFNLQTFGNVYSRISNPTVCALEERVAALEGGRAALAAASGMAAQTAALLTLAKQGDHIVAARTLYGGSYTQFAVTFAEFGIDTTFVDPDDPEAFQRALQPNTKAVYAETIGNPQLNVVDLAALAAVARGAGVPLVIDNTLASPFLCCPIEHGADIVIHSATKYLGGHGTTMGGVIGESGKFDWASGILTFGIKAAKGGGRLAGERFIEAVQFLSHLANVGDAKTLVIHPASTTHRQLDDDEQRAAGVLPEMVRLSVGLETLDDILWDIDQALDAATR